MLPRHTYRGVLQRRLLRWSLLVLFSAVATVLWPSSTFRAQEDCAGRQRHPLRERAARDTAERLGRPGRGRPEHPGFRDGHQRQSRRNRPVQDRHGRDGLPARHLPSGLLRRGRRAPRRDREPFGYRCRRCSRNVSRTPTTGLVDCGNWAVSASWPVPADATSGIYFARAERLDTGGASHIVFIVRNDASTSELLFQTSDTTWQAYNRYGGNSLYVGSPAGRAYKVSYNRPFTTRAVRARGLGIQRRVPDGPLARGQRLRRQLHHRRGLRSSRRQLLEPPGLPVGRPRRVLVGRSARQRRSGARTPA